MKMNRKIIIFFVIVLGVLQFYVSGDFKQDIFLKKNKTILIKNTKKIDSLDALGSIMLYCDDINEVSDFLSSYPEGVLKSQLRKHRRKLFLNTSNVRSSNLDIDSLLAINPCYTPIYKDIDRTKSKRKFELLDLINDFLPSNNPYKNRFLVADLNTVDLDNNSLGANEIFPDVENSWEFILLFDYLKQNGILKSNFSSYEKSHLDSLVQNKNDLKVSLKLYRNFLKKVSIYKTKPIKKYRSINNGKQFVTGQKVCLCEAQNDSIYFVGQFVTSGRGKSRTEILDSIEDNPPEYKYFEALPTGKDKNYYAPLYRITSKNWETQRKYGKVDKFRDSLMGGGNKRVTFFDGKSQLPNFMLMRPDPMYPRAMRQNGIHESSLSIVSKCMLGTPQSLGCLRMSDYTSKFLRWWTPQSAKLFVYIDESRCTNSVIDNIYKEMPFKNIKEGNVFRRWIHKNHLKYAKKLDLDTKGSCNNCYMYQAWSNFKNEFLSSDEGRIFADRISLQSQNIENHL